MVAKQRNAIKKYLDTESVSIMLPELRGVVNHLPVENIRRQLGNEMRAWSDQQICTAVVYGRIEPVVWLENRNPPTWQFNSTKAAEQQQRFYGLVDEAAARYFAAKRLSQGGMGRSYIETC